MKTKAVTMSDVFGNPKYRGKHVILVAGKLFTAKTGVGALKILKDAEKKYPKQVPEIVYIPKAHLLTL